MIKQFIENINFEIHLDMEPSVERGFDSSQLINEQFVHAKTMIILF